MPALSPKTVDLYGNVLNEIKVRLYFLDRALNLELKENIDWVMVSDLCCLQLRKIFEALSLGCLLIHGDLPQTNRLKKDEYRADKLLKGLGKLHAEFFPRPCKLGPSRGNQIIVQQPIGGEWLTKDMLCRFYVKLDPELHVGTLTRRSLTAQAISKESLERMRDLTIGLLRTHYITLTDPAFWLVVEMNDYSEKPVAQLLRV